jgi:hypothetical protein
MQITVKQGRKDWYVLSKMEEISRDHLLLWQ